MRRRRPRRSSDSDVAVSEPRIALRTRRTATPTPTAAVQHANIAHAWSSTGSGTSKTISTKSSGASYRLHTAYKSISQHNAIHQAGEVVGVYEMVVGLLGSEIY